MRESSCVCVCVSEAVCIPACARAGRGVDASALLRARVCVCACTNARARVLRLCATMYACSRKCARPAFLESGGRSHARVLSRARTC